MNADIKGMLDYFKRKKITCLCSDKGLAIPDKEAREYLKWCLEHGYKDLYSAPEWEEYLKIKESEETK